MAHSSSQRGERGKRRQRGSGGRRSPVERRAKRRGPRTDPPHAHRREEPAFAEFKHVGQPNIPDRARLYDRFDDILDRAWLTNNGAYVREFERRVAEVSEVRNCIAVCNGTIALNLIAQVLGLTGEVIMPSLTFIATPHAFAWQGLTPVFADVDPETCCIDPAHVESLITPRTSAIVGVHLWGQTCDVERLQGIADRHNLQLLFDASHAFACSANGKPVGSSGLAETFSFHATKFVSSIEGGAIVTDDDHFADHLRRARNFGFAAIDHVAELGTNAKLNEFSAAFGLTALESMQALTEHNRRNHETYAAELADVPGVRLLHGPTRDANNRQYVVVRINETECGVSRDAVMHSLHYHNIVARRYFFPGCHRAQPYAANQVPLPVTERLVDEVLVLPTGTAVSQDDVVLICRTLRSALRARRVA